MGVAFGRIEDACVEFVTIKTGKEYELRSYEPFFVAEIECDDEHLKDSFVRLMRYIGADGPP